MSGGVGRVRERHRGSLMVVFSADQVPGRDRPQRSQWPDGKLAERLCRAVIGQPVLGGLKVALSAISAQP